MNSVTYDLEVSHFHQLSSSLLSSQEASALKLGLQWEKKVARIHDGPMTQLFFCPQSPDSPLLRSFCAARSPETLKLSLERQLRGHFRRDTVRIPRTALRLALRGATARELFPEFPEGPEPVLAVTSQRFRVVHTSGWHLTLDEDIAFHALNTEFSWSEQALTPMAPLLGQERGANVELAVNTHAKVPDWLSSLVERLPRYSLFESGLSRLAAQDASRIRRSRALSAVPAAPAL